MKKNSNNEQAILTLLLLITLLFRDKFIYLAPNLSASISLLTYSLTFLVPILIFNKYKSKEAKKAILLSALYVFGFYLVGALLCTISGNLTSAVADNALKVIFAPDKFYINNTIIHYPDLFVLAFLLIYIISHYILISVYDAINSYTNTYLGFGIALFMSFIIDTMFTVPLYHLSDIHLANIGVIEIIKYLTANFMVVISTSLILVLSYLALTKPKAKKKNKKD